MNPSNKVLVVRFFAAAMPISAESIEYRCAKHRHSKTARRP